MQLIEARILLENLFGRIELEQDGSGRLVGVLTKNELASLQVAICLFGDLSARTPATAPIPSGPIEGNATALDDSPAARVGIVAPQQEAHDHILQLDLSTLLLPSPPKSVRLCLDFGTAMSKATLIADNESAETEDIHVLRLGVPGNQEEVSQIMLISSVYIDNEGLLWFGKAAVDHSMIEGGDGSRQRMDNIKRRLSEEGWEEPVQLRFNPSGTEVTHGDMVLAYLVYLTWATNVCLEELGYPKNVLRRFAMPCLTGEKGRETAYRLRKLIGEAQVLADTFNVSLDGGIRLSDFCDAVAQLRAEKRDYPYVSEDLTEPLGVAGSMMSWTRRVDNLVMVVDVGAGTSDLSLYRLLYDSDTGNSIAKEIEHSSRVLTEAGNYLDRVLIEQIIKKSGITSEDPVWINVRSALELEIRNFKETLFNDGSIFVSLMNGDEVELDLGEFLDLDAVRHFERSLRATMIEILESIDDSWIKWIKAHPTRNLVIAMTGGGAELPMVRSLAEGTIRVHDLEVPLKRALPFPSWLREIDENLEDDYPRIAVSLGGARRRLIERGDAARITAGDVTQPPRLGGYFQKGI